LESPQSCAAFAMERWLHGRIKPQPDAETEHAMMADSRLHSARLAGSLTPTRRRRRRSQGVLALMLMVLGLAVLLSLAVMFLPLSHPQMRLGPRHPDQPPARPFVLPPLE
jgi:ferric-dicitrate binding protein FerR (iron transport regulator)